MIEMALTNEFIDAVTNNKKTRVRIMLKDIMLVDPSMKTFNEMLSWRALMMKSQTWKKMDARYL